VATAKQSWCIAVAVSFQACHRTRRARETTTTKTQLKTVITTAACSISASCASAKPAGSSPSISIAGRSAAAIAAATTALWQQGVFTDGGGFDPRQRERSRALRSPYSFVLGGIPTPAGRFNISGGAPGVDFIDLMGLHADIMRAAHEGFIGQQDAASAAGI
jgi:hypothetical protein